MTSREALRDAGGAAGAGAGAARARRLSGEMAPKTSCPTRNSRAAGPQAATRPLHSEVGKEGFMRRGSERGGRGSVLRRRADGGWPAALALALAAGRHALGEGKAAPASERREAEGERSSAGERQAPEVAAEDDRQVRAED